MSLVLGAGDENPFAGARHPTRLLVIAPKSLEPALLPLIAHKKATGMSAFLVTIETLRETCPGRDDAEHVKRGIALAQSKLRTEFVLLVGDASLFPVRYRQVQQVDPQARLDGTYNPSELYYANLYHDHRLAPTRDDPEAIGNSGKFDTWDADGDGRFNEQHWKDDAASYNPDAVDGCPDVAIGRLPVHDLAETQRYVEKVILYETHKPDPRWNQRYAFFADRDCALSTNFCDNVIGGMGGRPLADEKDIDRLLMNAVDGERIDLPWTRGSFERLERDLAQAWWATYMGHAGPQSWLIAEAGRNYDEARVRALANKDHHPIVVALGCESGMFAEWQPRGRYRDMQGAAHQFFWHEDKHAWQDHASGEMLGPRLAVPQPGNYDLAEASNRTFACSWLLSAAGGGAIAYFGETLVKQNDTGAELLRAMLARYTAGERILGEIWLHGQRKYWLDNRANENVWRHPRIYLGILTLFGDPSLRLGGRAAEKR